MSGILVVWPEYPPSVGGMEIHGLEFVRFLRELKLPFTVVTREPSTAAFRAEALAFDEAAGIKTIRELPRSDFQRALRWIRQMTAALRPQVVYSSQLAYAPAFGRQVRVVCRTAGNDILRPWIGPASISLAQMQRCTEAERVDRVRANAEWIRHAADWCDELLCNSEWTAGAIRRHFSVASMTVLRGGVDVRRFRPLNRRRYRAHLTYGSNEPLLLLAARHVLKKGIDVALNAIARLDRPAKLVIAGIGPETRLLFEQASKLRIRTRVRFVGPIAHQVMPTLMGMADVVLIPSRSVYDPSLFGADEETMGRVACEAAAAGTPVVASRTGGLPEVVQDGRTGMLVSPGDPDVLAAAVCQLLDDSSLRQRLGENARRWAVESLSFEMINRLTLDRLLAA
jgi:phosphatidyl-myo-inositol dimannoside synthase